MRDEVVIGFRSGDSETDAWNGKLQMLMVKTTQVVTSTATTTYPYSDTLVMDDQVWVEHKIGSDFSQAATMVSLAGADLDGDGRDEIAVGYNRVYASGEHESRKWQQHLVTYKYVDVMEPNYPFPGCSDDSGKPRGLSRRTIRQLEERQHDGAVCRERRQCRSPCRHRRRRPGPGRQR